MGDITTKYGDNAGKIWLTLNEKGCLKKKNLLKVAQLRDDEFYSGIGWLAKENKVSKEDKDCFKLDNTNLDSEIGTHAGRVWKILDIWGESDFVTLKRLSDLKDEQVHSALGWLAREDKIEFGEKQKYNLK
jgi:hypothetical protein